MHPKVPLVMVASALVASSKAKKRRKDGSLELLLRSASTASLYRGQVVSSVAASVLRFVACSTPCCTAPPTLPALAASIWCTCAAVNGIQPLCIQSPTGLLGKHHVTRPPATWAVISTLRGALGRFLHIVGTRTFLTMYYSHSTSCCSLEDPIST
jgi:hypothetical protein